MCGISAIWVWSKKEITFKPLYAMAKAQTHRGPDGHGYAVWSHGRDLNRRPMVWVGPNTASPDIEANHLRLGLAHNWLAIQDTSSVARQPMTIGTQRYWVIYNGEIYNFVELREELLTEGLCFKTSSDTEVLLALWQKMGPEALDKLRGMFAFIIYDFEEDVLWAVRDRFGIKPLYYVVLPEDRGIILASEFRGIHASGLVPRRWNELAVKAFLVAGVNNPGDETTFFDGVNELPPGCLLQIAPGKVVTQRYYLLPRAEDPVLGAEVLSELRTRFIKAIDLHLRSAREVGTCMSGGLDSTSIASAIHQVLGDRVADFKAFTIGSPGNGDFELAQLASKHIGFRHYTVKASRTIDLADLVDMIIACETPNHVWGPINQYLLLRHISAKHGLHVLLDGQGGDEVFSGYAWFYPVIEEFISNTLGSEEAASLRASHFSKPPFPLPLLESFHQTFFSRRKWIESIDGGASTSLGLSIEEVMQCDPVNYYLNDTLDWATFREREFYRRELQYLLKQEDRLAMWFSIESRVPFLDHIFVEWVNRLSPGFLMQDGYLKYPLRILFPDLPEEVRFNVVKRGFWEDYSSLPYFEYIARSAVQHSEGLSRLVQNKSSLDKMSIAALWRFFQMAVLLEAGSKEEGRTWVNDFLKRVPVGAFTLYPWFQGLRRHAGSFVRIFK
jgi:asparagine synthase (glutamine-hydrolysing)